MGGGLANATAVIIALVAMQIPPRPMPIIPEGDLVVPLETVWRRMEALARVETRAASRLRLGSRLRPALEAAARWLDKTEIYGRTWSLGGAALILIALIFGAVLAR